MSPGEGRHSGRTDTWVSAGVVGHGVVERWGLTSDLEKALSEGSEDTDVVRRGVEEASPEGTGMLRGHGKEGDMGNAGFPSQEACLLSSFFPWGGLT